jgi:hypothetical protein
VLLSVLASFLGDFPLFVELLEVDEVVSIHITVYR